MQKKFFLPLLGLLGLPSVASAAETFNYVTYGGFDAIFIAIQKITLITSDGGFSALVGAAAVLGIILGGIMSISQAAQSGGKVSINFILAMMLGSTIYASMFVKTATLTIEDEAFSKMGVVEDVPYGLAFLLHHFSKIEVGIIELTDTATMGGESYAGAVGGMGLNTTRAVVGYQLRDSVIRVTMKNYIEDCVLFELVRPGTTLSVNALHYGSDDLITTLEKAASPSIYTVYQDEGGGDTTMTCQAAYTNIKNWFAVPSNLEAEVDRACGSAFFNTANIQEKSRCREVVSETLLKATGVNMTSEKLLTQALITNVFMDVARSGDAATVVEVEANQQAGSSLFGMGVAASEWIPVIKGVITAVFISLIPFLAIFLVTPIYGRVLSFIVGFIAFVTTWGIVDAIANGLMVSYSYQFLSTLQGETNMFAMMAFPTLTMKTVAMIGGVRSMGAMISALVVSVLFPKLNSQAFAMMAGGLQGVTQSAGTKAGQLITPEGTSQEISQHQSAMGTQSMYSSGRFDVDGARNMAMNDTKNKIASSWQGEGYRDFGDAMSLGSTRGRTAAGTTDMTQLLAGKYAGGDERKMAAMVAGNTVYVDKDGSHAVGVTTDGKEVKDDRSIGHTATVAGNENNETTQVKKNSAGDISVGSKELLQHSRDKGLSEVKSETERAGEARSKSWSTVKSQATSLQNTTQNLDGLSASEQATVSSAIATVASRSNAASETTGFSDTASQQDLSSNRSNISVAGEGGLSTGKNPAGGGSAGGSISGGSSLEKGHSDTTGQGASSNLSHTDSKSVADSESANLAKAQQILESHGYTELAGKVESLQSSYSGAQTKTNDYSTAVDKQHRFEESQRLAEQHSINGDVNLDKPMMALANQDKYMDKYNIPEENRGKAWEYMEQNGMRDAQLEVQKDFLDSATETLKQTGDFSALEKQWGVEIDGKLEAGRAGVADVDPAAAHAAVAKEIEGKAAEQIKAPASYDRQEKQLELEFGKEQKEIRNPAEAEIAEAAKTTNIMANHVETNAVEKTHKGLAEDVLDRFEGLYNKIPNIFER